MKLTRGAYRTYLDASFGSETPIWFLIGKDMEEANVDLGADVEVIKNILDETTVKHNGYEPSMEADPYYANPEDSIYPTLRNIVMNRLKGDECRTKILEVIVEDTDATKHRAWMESVVVVPSTYGGDTSGFQIPFTVNFDGDRVEGSVTFTNKVPTFTDTPVSDTATASTMSTKSNTSSTTGGKSSSLTD